MNDLKDTEMNLEMITREELLKVTGKLDYQAENLKNAADILGHEMYNTLSFYVNTNKEAFNLSDYEIKQHHPSKYNDNQLYLELN